MGIRVHKTHRILFHNPLCCVSPQSLFVKAAPILILLSDLEPAVIQCLISPSLCSSSLSCFLFLHR